MMIIESSQVNKIMKNIKETSTVELVKKVQYIERDIALMLKEYNDILEELYYRFPFLKEEEEFKQKELVKK